MTVAYSDKYNFWTSKYSFEPTCYASVDNHFLSCKDGVYRHDIGKKRNEFYDETFPSEIVVASNENPSTIKFYNSISLETNRNEFTAEVFTNEEYDGVEAQEGSFVGFESREGFQYADMPRSTKNSSGNVFPLPSPLQFIDGGLISGDNSQSKNFKLPSVPVDIGIPFSQGEVYRVYQILNGSLVNPAQAEDENEVGLEVYVTEVKSDIIILKFLTPDTETLNLFANTVAAEEDGGTFYDYDLVILSPAQMDGDQMRGPYAKIKLSIDGDAANKPFEFHALNVEYEFSRLDKGLTEKS